MILDRRGAPMADQARAVTLAPMKGGNRTRARWIAGGATLLAVAVFCWAWGSAPVNLRERIFPKNLAVVVPDSLYRSGQIRPNLIEGTLRDLDIDVIVDLSHDLGAHDASQVAEKEAARKLGIELKRFPLNGSGTGEISSFVGAIEEIARDRREGRRVLVHCRAGDRRTGAVIAVYQMLVLGRDPAAARVEMERFTRRPGVESTLTRFLAEHLDEIARGLLDAGVIERLPESMTTSAGL